MPGDFATYRTFVFGVAAREFPIDSIFAFVIFHGLVWSSFFVIAGVMLAFRRRMIDHGAVALDVEARGGAQGLRQLSREDAGPGEVV